MRVRFLGSEVRKIKNQKPKIKNPEQSWERGVHREVSGDEIRAMLGVVAPGDELSSADLISSGKANTNYAVRLSSGRRVLLRMYVRDPETCAKEAALARLVSGHVPAPALVYAACECAYSVWEWVDGTLLEESLELLPDCAYDLGKVLAAIGEFRFDRAGFLDGDLGVCFGFGEACEAYIGRIKECLDMETVRARMGEELAVRTGEFVTERVGLLDPYRGNSHLVHSDYKVSNILVEGGRVVGVLDWEFAHSGSPLLDVSILFRHRDLWPEAVAQEFARGFRDHGGFLDPVWQEATRYLDLVSLLDFLSRPGLGQRATEDVVRLIRATVK